MRSLAATCALALLLGVALAARAAAQCNPNGLTLATTGGRLGDPFTISLTGTPSVSGLLGLDLAPGPVATPIGPLCLGLSQAIQTIPFTLNASGTFGISGLVPPNPALAGLGVYAQAAAADPTQPGGFAVSNGAHPVLRSPRIFFIDPGTGTNAGSGVAFDAITDTFGPVVSLPSSVKAAVAVPALGWVAMLLGNGSLIAFDAATGALTLNQPFTTNVSAWHALAAAGTTLVITESNAFPAPATLQTISLPSGAPSSVIPLPVAGGVEAIITPPGAGTAYLIASVPGYSISNTIIPIALPTGTPLPPITLSPGFDYVYEWLVRNGIIYFLTAPSGGGLFGLNAIDTSLNVPFFPNPVPLPFSGPIFGSPPLFNFGPGTLGPTLFVRDPVAATLLQRSPLTLSYLAPPIPLPAGIIDVKLSNGGTEWLLNSCPNCLGFGGPGTSPAQTLLTLNATTHLIATVGPLPSGYFGALRVLPSATLNRAFFVSNGVVAPIPTDPATPPGPTVPLPPPLYSVSLIVD